MIRRAINILSPIAALALLWLSLQGLLFTDQANPAEPLLAPPTSVVASQFLPELGSVSEILATTSSVASGESVPDTVRAILIEQGAVLLIPDQRRGGGQ